MEEKKLEKEKNNFYKPQLSPKGRKVKNKVNILKRLFDSEAKRIEKLAQ